MTTASFNIPITDDNILEDNEIIQIEVSSLPRRVNVSNPYKATVSIIDDDGEVLILLSYTCDLVTILSHTCDLVTIHTLM